jgi:hypothetical protein
MEAKKVSSIMEASKEYEYYDKPKHSKHIDNDVLYRKIMTRFMQELAYNLIITGKRVKLPHSLGSLQIVRYKVSDDLNKRPIDRKNTKLLSQKLGHTKVVRHSNLSTDGYWVRLHWFKKPLEENKYGARFKYSRNYQLRLTRPNLRPNPYNKKNPKISLYPYFKKEGYKFYYELPNLFYHE